MTQFITKLNRWRLAMTLLVVTLCLTMFVGAVKTWVRFASAEDDPELQATLIVSTVYDDYTVDTIKKALEVEETTTGTVYGADDYTVTFAKTLTAGEANSLTITCGTLSCTLEIPMVTAATYTPQIAVPGYDKVGNYYVDGEGYDAFVQGMDEATVEERLAVAIVSSNPHAVPQIVSFDGESVTWSSGSAPDFGNSSSTVNLSVDISLTVSGYDEPVTEAINFNTLHEFALALGTNSAGAEWTQPAGLKSSTQINTSFINSLNGYVYICMNNGELQSNHVSVTESLATGGCIGITAEAFINKPAKFDMTLTISPRDAYKSLKPLVLELKDIIYEEPTSVEGIEGKLPDQIARSELNCGDLSINVKYNKTVCSIPLKDFIAAGQTIKNVKYYIGEEETDLLTRNVTRITFSCAGHDYDSADYDDVFVSRLAQDSPLLDNEEVVFSDNCYVTLNGFVTDDVQGDNMKLEIVEGADGIKNISDGKIEFNRGGSFKVAVSFIKGDNSDFYWRITNGGGQLIGDKVVYTIIVTNAPIDITLNFPATLQYGDNEPDFASIVSGVVEGSPSMSMEGLGTRHKADTPVYDNDNPNTALKKTPNYRVVYTGKYIDDNENEQTYTDKYNFPTARGSYQVYIETEPTSYYLKGTSETVSFVIEKRQISLGAIAIQSKVFTLGVKYNIPDASGKVASGVTNLLDGNTITVNGLVNGDTIANVMKLSKADASDLTHVGDYKIKFEITSKNYKWENDAAYKEETFKITKRNLSFNLSQDGMTYGETLPTAKIDSKWTENKATGGAADFDDYVTLSPSYKNKATDTAVTAPASGALWQAGNYSVTYSATPKTGVDAGDINCTEKTADFTVARKQLTRVDVVGTASDYTYTGKEFTFNVDKWSQATGGIVSVDTVADVLKIAATGTLFNGNDITTNITNAQNGVIKVIEAGTYTFTVSIVNDNYEWVGGSTDDVEKQFTIEQKELALNLDIPAGGYFFDGVKHVPAMLSQTLIDAGLTYSWTTLKYYSVTDESLTEITDPEEIIPAGKYRIEVVAFEIEDEINGAYSYAVNYKLSATAYSEYEIQVTTVIKPVFDMSVDGVTSESAATVTYKGADFDITDYIKDWNKYLYLNGTKQTVVITITLDGTKADLHNAGTYTVSVTPAESYTWSDNSEGAVTLSFTINQLAIEVDWTEATLSLIYDGTARSVTGYKLNKQGTDEIDVTLKYTQNGSEIQPVNVGSYNVEATEVTGTHAANYTLTGGKYKTNTLVINKYSLKVPTMDGDTTVAFGTTSKTFTLQDTSSVTGFDWNTAVNVSVSGQWKFDGTAYGNHPANSATFSFDTATLSFTHAGEYVVTFTIANENGNYQWADNLTGAQTRTLIVNRGQVTAPVLGAQRTLEYKTDDEGRVITQAPAGLTVDGLTLTPKYGIAQQYTTVSDTVTSSVYGLYFVKLVIDGYYLDYQWVQNTSDSTNMNILDAATGAVWTATHPSWGHTVYSADESSVYLHYMITKGILKVEYTVSDYTFGDNGFGGAYGHGVEGKTDTLLWGGNDKETITTAGGEESLAFYKFENAPQGRPSNLKDLAKYTDLENGLPWEAGYYGVLVTITFPVGSPYETITEWYSFKVEQRVLTFNWSGNQTVIYNGEARGFTVTATNEVYKTSADDKVTFPTLFASLDGTKGNLPVNARNTSYTLYAYIDGNESNFKLPDTRPSRTLKIEQREVRLNVVASDAYTSVYGNPLKYRDTSLVTWAYVDGVAEANKFVGNTDGLVDYRLYTIGAGDTEGTVVSTDSDYRPNAGSYWLVPVLINQSGNYKLKYDYSSAKYKVAKRDITVALNTPNAKSAYYTDINLYADGVYSVTWNNPDGADATNWNAGAAVTSIFTLSTAATKNSNVGEYAVTLTKVSANYDITYTEANWEITAVEINDATVSTKSNVIYKGTGYNIIGGLVDVTYTLTNSSANRSSVKWFYKAEDDTDWTEITSATITNVINKKYSFKVTANNHLDKEVGECDVIIKKATLTVAPSMTIQYGEQSPASYQGGCYNATVAHLSNPEGSKIKYTVKGLNGETLADIGEISGSFSYTTTYVQGDAEKGVAGIYNLTFVPNNLESQNYVFVNEVSSGNNVGKLTVVKLNLTVTVSHIETAYYSAFATSLFDGHVTIGLPNSTYTGVQLTSAELAENVNTALTTKSGYIGANIFTLTTAAYTVNNSTGKTQNVGTYDITGTVKDAVKNNYSIVLDGDQEHEIVKATLAVKSDINGYTAAYDEQSHSAIVDGENKAIALNNFATASDGTAITVRFHAEALASGNPANAAATEWATWTANSQVLTSNPQYIDVCRMAVYYRIEAGGNYEVVYGSKVVEITKSQNSITNLESLKVAGWTYGLYSAGNPDGYRKQTLLPIEPTTAFKRLADGVDNTIKLTLLRNGNAIEGLTGEYSTIESLYDSMWAKGLFVAGDYTLIIEMVGTDNYDAWNNTDSTFTFTVAKKVLTVTPDDIRLVYGSDIPEYTYKVEGFVINVSGGSLETIDVLDKDGVKGDKHNFFTSTYQPGYESGSVGEYDITHSDGDGVIEGLTTLTLDNYTLKFETGELEIYKREVTIKIEDKQNTYNLNKGSETASKLTFKVTNGSFYEFDSQATYDNDNQSVVILKTVALKGADGIRTNNVIVTERNGNNFTLGAYPVYAVYGSYDESQSYSSNYDIKFSDCQYSGAITSENLLDSTDKPIGSTGNAGNFTITQAVLSIQLEGWFYNNDGGAKVKNEKGFYSGKAHHAEATVPSEPTLKITFIYQKLENGTYRKLAENEQIINVGTYRAIGICDSDNYFANESVYDFNLLQATLILQAKDAKIEYGTELSCTPNVTRVENEVYDASERFTGFAFNVATIDNEATKQLQPSVIAAYLNAKKVSYVSSTYKPSTMVGQQCYITPVCASDSNISVVCNSGDLEVLKRQVVVTLKGYFEGNTLAQCDYLGVQAPTQAKLTDAYRKNWAQFIEVDDIGYSGDELSALAISFALPENAINAKATGYGMAVSSDATNYDVKFKTSGDELKTSVGFNDKDAPKFVINKAKLTVYAHSAVSNQVPQTYSVVYGNRATYSYSVAGMQNDENFNGIISDAGVKSEDITYTVKCGNKVFAPWLSNVGETYTVSVDEFDFTLENYELTKDGGAAYIDTTLSITARPIVVSTEDQVYDWDGSDYHGGRYGKAHNAVLTYSDIQAPNDTTIRKNLNDTYKPSVAALTYDTDASEGQTKYAAPTKVGEYHVTVNLTGNNYVFRQAGSANATSAELEFNVTKREISEGNLSWNKSSIRVIEGEENDGYNVIGAYIKDIMEIRLFTYNAYGQVGSVDIVSGDSSTPNTYYFVGQNLAINANGRGRYEVQIQLKDSATDNYVFKSSNGIRIVSAFTVTSSSIDMTLSIEDWIYGNTPNSPEAQVNGENNDGIRFTYARVTNIDNIDNFYGREASSNIDNLVVGTYGDISTMVFNAAYYVVSAKYEGVIIGEDGTEETHMAQLYYVFRVTPAKVDLPAAIVADYTFNGQEQGLVIEYNTLLVRASYEGHTGTADKGMIVYATNAGKYEVTFALSDSNNYEWNTEENTDGIELVEGVVTLSWTIAKDDSANDSEVLSMTASNTATYGSVSLGSATIAQGYDGYVTRYWAVDNGQSASEVTSWTQGLPVNAGDYHIRLRLSSVNGVNYADKNIYVKLHVDKLEATVTASGTVTYGNDWRTGRLSYTSSQLAYSTQRVTGTAEYRLVSDTYGKLEVNGEYYIVITSNENGIANNIKVTDNGLDVSSNYILKVAEGRLTVNPRPITVTLGNATSQYGRPIDTSNVNITYGANQLVESDSLNLTLSTTALRTDGAHSVVGGYTITAEYNNPNYTATIIAGTYTITERRIKIELSSNGGGEYGNVRPVTYGKVYDDQDADITSFVDGKLTLSIIYTGMANNGQSYSGTTTPVNAGTYIATVQGSGSGNFIIVGETFIQFVIDKKELDASKIVIASQTYTGDVLQPVINNSAFVTVYGDNLYDELAHADFINVGSHIVTLRLKDQNNYKWLAAEVPERELMFVIDKANNELTSAITINGWVYNEYDADANLPEATVKFGQDYIVYTYSNSLNGVYHSGAPTTGDVGEYYVRVTVPSSDNYNGFESAPAKFTITKKALAKPTLTFVSEGDGKNDVYTGDELYSTILGFDWSLMGLTCEGKFNVVDSNVVLVAINAGTYTVAVSIRNTNNYRFEDTDDNTITLTWNVARKAIAKPTENTRLFIVNGQILTYIPEGFDEEIMTIENNQTAYGGRFVVTIGLKDTDNYVWADDSFDNFDLVWIVVGVATVFYIVVGTLGGASFAAVVAAGVQLLLDKRRRRLINRDIDARSRAEAEKNDSQESTAQANNEGGNN